MKHLYNIIFFVILVLFTSCSNNTPASIENYSYTLGNNSTLLVGRSSQINVFAHFSDGTLVNVNDKFIWSSSDESVASVANGFISILNPSSNIVISFKTKETLSDGGAIYSQSVSFEAIIATLTSLRVTPNLPIELNKGTQKTLVATGYFDTNDTSIITKECDWLSSNTNILSVTNGIVTAKNEGNATVTAQDTQTGLEDSVFINVLKSIYTSLNISSLSTIFNAQQTIQLSAVATTSTGEEIIVTDDVTWKSNNPSAVTIDANSGLATAVAIGTAAITATLSDPVVNSNTIILEVKKDTYLALFDDTNNSLAFPYVAYEEISDNNTTLKKFTLKAIGSDFVIQNLVVRDFNGNFISSALFLNLANNQTIPEGNSVEFELRNAGNEPELEYFFSIGPQQNFSSNFKRVP